MRVQTLRNMRIMTLRPSFDACWLPLEEMCDKAGRAHCKRQTSDAWSQIQKLELTEVWEVDLHPSTTPEE